MKNKDLIFAGYTYQEGDADRFWDYMFRKIIRKRLHNIQELHFKERTGHNTITACDIV